MPEEIDWKINQTAEIKSLEREDEKKNVIYEICCKNCNRDYFSETGRCLKTRKFGHVKIRKNKRRRKNTRGHMITTLDFENAKVIH